jgi:2-polyprenyl-3-methyl-5-hydroxy-6-metoxy-1,4-benzoquinol methylase
MVSPVDPVYRHVDELEASRANRIDWDASADDYQAEHGSFLRDVGFVWCPEGLDESEAGLLGELSGRRVLEVGCGAAQCSRWMNTQGATTVGFDLSVRQLQHSRRIDQESGVAVPVACATVTALPFADQAFDIVCSAFGALPFVVDIGRALSEMARVVHPGGLVAFSVVHPLRRMFPDDPTTEGLHATRSYFDRRSYVETDGVGSPTYVEPHHTLGDWIDAITSAGLVVERIIEPEWPPRHDRVWGGWGPERGRVLPGTAIFSCRSPRASAGE